MTTLLLLAALAFQDVARPAAPEDVRHQPTVFVAIPLVRLNGLLPALGMIWIEMPNPLYIPEGPQA